jgi:hypothetical protein
MEKRHEFWISATGIWSARRSGLITTQKVSFVVFLMDATKHQEGQMQIGTLLRQTYPELPLSSLSYWSRTTNFGGSHLTLGPQNVHIYCVRFGTFTALYGDKEFCDDKWNGAEKIRRHTFTKLTKDTINSPSTNFTQAVTCILEVPGWNLDRDIVNRGCRGLLQFNQKPPK